MGIHAGVSGDNIDDLGGDDFLSAEFAGLDEALKLLFGRSQRHASELAAILVRLDQLKAEIRLHQAKLKQDGSDRHPQVGPESGLIQPTEEPPSDRPDAA